MNILIPPPKKDDSRNDSQQVLDSFNNFAEQIGYKDSIHKDKFITLLEERYSFLIQFRRFNRSSKFWINNSSSLIDQDQKMRKKLNDEILYRKNPKRCKIESIHLTVSGLSDFIFCPVSYAIKNTFETPEIDALEDSLFLRKDNYVEDIIKNIMISRKLDFLLSKMNQVRKTDQKLSKNIFELNKVEIEEFEIEGKFNVFLSVTENKIIWPKLPNETRRIEEKVIVQESMQVSKDDYSSFIQKGNYGDLIGSEIIYKGSQNDGTNYYKNNKYNIVGNPDYLFKKQDGNIFLLLSKLKWDSKILTQPFDNHIYQALAYIYFYPALEIKYGYILYIQSIKILKLHKIKTSKFHIDKLLKYHKELTSFVESKSINFDPKSITVSKCFGCSVRMFCSHKAGSKDTIKIPYEIN